MRGGKFAPTQWPEVAYEMTGISSLKASCYPRTPAGIITSRRMTFSPNRTARFNVGYLAEKDVDNYYVCSVCLLSGETVLNVRIREFSSEIFAGVLFAWF